MIGQELKRLRQQKGDSLRDVEAATGINYTHLHRIETGKTIEPPPNVLRRLAEYYSAPYIRLMQLAGYLEESVEDELTPRDEAERRAVAAFLACYRQMK